METSQSDDIHAQASLLDTWNQHYTQLSRGAFRGEVTSLHAPLLRVFAERMNRAVLQRGEFAPGRLGFGIATRASGKCNLCGEAGMPGDLLVFSGPEGFEFLSPDGFEFIGLEIKASPRSDPELAALVGRLDTRLRGLQRAVRLPPGRSEALAESLRTVLGLFDGRAGSGLAGAPVRAMQRQLIGSVIDCLEGADPGAEDSRSARTQWAIVSAIRESVHANPDCPLSVAELSLRLDVPRRTLQNAVASALDMSPIALLRALRLGEARREMAGAASVTEVATRWGFWHFGYFARDYRAMFGELPSETLRRSRGEARRAH